MTELQAQRKAAVRLAADSLTVQGMTAIINLDTWEADNWMFNMDWLHDEEDEEDEEMEGRPNWENAIEIESLEAFESFEIMQDFVCNELPKGRFQQMMERVLEGRKPFANFNHQIHNSEYREAWFAYRLDRLEAHVKTLVVLKWKGGMCSEEDKEEFYPTE